MSVLLKVCEGFINKVIAQDERAMGRVSALAGKVLAIHVSDWNWCALVIFNNQGILLVRDVQGDGEADVTIEGRGVDLLKLLASGDQRASVQGGGIHMTGALSVAQAMQKLGAELAIDWEGMLAPIMGNWAAHEVSTAAKASKRFMAKIAKKARKDTADALHDELGLAPNPIALDDFYRQIEELRADTDRLWQRFQQRAEKHKQS